MKNLVRVCLCLLAVIGNSFAEEFLKTMPLEDFEKLYEMVCRDNLRRIQEAGADGIITNVFPVYMAGYVHSTSAIPVLLERIDWTGLNEPERFYGDVPDRSSVSAIQQIRLGLVSRLPQPPTPSVGALTQIQVPWETLRGEMERSVQQSRRLDLLAWVACVRHPVVFSSWLSGKMQTDSNRWEQLSRYATTNLVGRKPFYLGDYCGCREFCCRETKALYDGIVGELRRRAMTSTSQEERNAILAMLSTMGQPSTISDANEMYQAVELLPEEEHPDRILDILDVPDA